MKHSILPSLFRKPHRIILFFACCLLFASAILKYSSAPKVNYIQTSGTIQNIEETLYRTTTKVFTRYNFDLVWYSDGKQYTKHFENYVYYEPNVRTTIWVHPNNTDAELVNPIKTLQTSKTLSSIAINIGIVGFVIWIFEILRKKMKHS